MNTLIIDQRVIDSMPPCQDDACVYSCDWATGPGKIYTFKQMDISDIDRDPDYHSVVITFITGAGNELGPLGYTLCNTCWSRVTPPPVIEEDPL